MRVGFAGTPAFAARALASIETEGFTIPLVLTQPDRPFGRGLSIAPPPVKRYAAEHELPEPEELITEAMEELQLALDDLADMQRLLEGNGANGA